MTLHAESRWGEKFLVNLSSNLRAKLPGVKGLSKQVLDTLKELYLIYNEQSTIHPQVGGESRTVIWHIPREYYKHIIGIIFYLI